MRSPKTILKELELIEAMLSGEHPTVEFVAVDKVTLYGAGMALRWVMGNRRDKPVTRMVRPRRRRVQRRAH
jgi:hypothetical protein